MATVRDVSRWNPQHGTLHVLDEVLVAYTLCDADLAAALGTPTRTDATSRIWEFQSRCGLRIRAVAHDLGGDLSYLSVTADKPEIGHVIRHLGIPADPDWRGDDSPGFAARTGKASPLWAVWVFDRAVGRAVLVARHSGERDAACHVRMLGADGADRAWMGASIPDDRAAATADEPAHFRPLRGA